jgi:hypothetical protein
MPIRLDTVLRKVEQMSNGVNSDLLKEFYQHMKDNGTLCVTGVVFCGRDISSEILTLSFIG